jgi:hypothetical protein
MLDKYFNYSLDSNPKRYTGTMEKYKGPCVCERITNSNEKNPFPWKEMTKGGQFPKNCFECSCGKNHFCYSPEKNSGLK